MKIALYQYPIIWEEKDKNISKVEKVINDHFNEGIDVIFLPEMSFSGFSMNINKTRESDYYTLNRIQSIAKDYSVAIGFGWVKSNAEKAENHYSVVCVQ